MLKPRAPRTWLVTSCCVTTSTGHPVTGCAALHTCTLCHTGPVGTRGPVSLLAARPSPPEASSSVTVLDVSRAACSSCSIRSCVDWRT